MTDQEIIEIVEKIEDNHLDIPHEDWFKIVETLYARANY